MLRLTAAAAMQVPDFLPAAALPAADGFFAQKPTAVEGLETARHAAAASIQDREKTY